MPAVNYKGKESEQSKARRKAKKPIKLGWGLLDMAKTKIKEHQAKVKKHTK